jgi:hypothetical protein
MGQYSISPMTASIYVCQKFDVAWLRRKPQAITVNSYWSRFHKLSTWQHLTVSLLYL